MTRLPNDAGDSDATGDQHRASNSSPDGRTGHRGRRVARTLAFQVLYEVDVARHPPREVLRRLEQEQSFPPEADEYARRLVSGVLHHRGEVDGIIQEKAPAWPLSQMAAVDRNILRLGIYECLYERDTVPARAAINEAVELAKTFGSDSSARFVNGVLGRVIESLPAEPDTGPDQATNHDDS